MIPVARFVLYGTSDRIDGKSLLAVSVLKLPYILRWVCLVAVVGSFEAAHAQTTASGMPDGCGVRLAVDSNGHVFFYANGWFRTNFKRLETIMTEGLWPKECSREHPITAVRLDLLPDAPPGRIDSVYALMDRHGWPKEKVRTEHENKLSNAR